MSTGAIIGIVIGAVVVLVLAALVVRLSLQQRELRARFGPEYDRVLDDQPGRRAAVRELTERERRYAALDIQPISATSRDRYTKGWALIQSKFVDRPSDAVDEADRLVISIMQECGYPVDDFDERLAVLSVQHAPMLGHYRDANDIRDRHQESQVSTEELRTAMVHYRKLIEDLLDAKPKPVRVRPMTPAGNGKERQVAEEETVTEDKVAEEEKLVDDHVENENSARPIQGRTA